MPALQRRTSPDEIARRGEDIYARELRERLEREHAGMVVAIDIHSGDHAVAATALQAGRELRVLHPQAEVWLIRVGQSALHRMGAGGLLVVPGRHLDN